MEDKIGPEIAAAKRNAFHALAELEEAYAAHGSATAEGEKARTECLSAAAGHLETAAGVLRRLTESGPSRAR